MDRVTLPKLPDRVQGAIVFLSSQPGFRSRLVGSCEIDVVVEGSALKVVVIKVVVIIDDSDVPLSISLEVDIVMLDVAYWLVLLSSSRAVVEEGIDSVVLVIKTEVVKEELGLHLDANAS